MLNYFIAGTALAFAPKGMKRRMAMHLFATAAGIAGALWFDPAHAIVTGLLLYAAFFVIAHLIVVPFIATFLIVRERFDRFIRSIVEEELIRFDLRTYQRQFQRVFPKMKPPDDERYG